MRILSVLFGVGLLAGTASAQVYKPFTHVDSVCERCTVGLPFDRISLKTGGEVRAKLVAENDAFFVLERFGEWRAVGRDQVVTIARNAAVVRPPGLGDQILLEGDIVLAGTIDGELASDADHFEIRVPGTPTPLHRVTRASVTAIYRAGKRVYRAVR